MRAVFTYGGSVVLVGLVLWAALAVLPACGAQNRIAWTWSDWCPVNTNLAAENQLASLTDANRSLERAILQRERELAALQCVPDVPVQIAEPKQTEPEKPPLPEKIDRKDWNDRRIGLLEGCWELESRFVTNNRETGETSRYNVWEMCFDATGKGREEMLADNGATCEGPVQGRFDGNGKLIIEEPANLQCSDGEYIYRLRSACELNDNGTASCVVSQPEVGGSTTVEFRRSARDN